MENDPDIAFFKCVPSQANPDNVDDAVDDSTAEFFNFLGEMQDGFSKVIRKNNL